MLSNRTLTPVAGPLRVTTPLRAKPLTQIFPFGTHNPISTLAPGFTGLAVSTRHPPALVFERLPQIEVGESSTRNSTATKHLMRGCRRRSLLQLGLKRSGSNGGSEDGGVGTGRGVSFSGGAGFNPFFEASALISRMAVSKACSRFSGGASR